MSERLLNLTVNSGTSIEILRNEIRQEVIERLRPIILAGGGEVLEYHADILISDFDGHGKPNTCFVQVTSDGEDNGDIYSMSLLCCREQFAGIAWRRVLATLQVSEGRLRRADMYPPALNCPPVAPWLATLLLPKALELPRERLLMLRSLERWIAWAVIDAQPSPSNGSSLRRPG